MWILYGKMLITCRRLSTNAKKTPTLNKQLPRKTNPHIMGMVYRRSETTGPIHKFYLPNNLVQIMINI